MRETVQAQEFSDWRMCRSVFEVTEAGRYSLNFCANNRDPEGRFGSSSRVLLISGINVIEADLCR